MFNPNCFVPDTFFRCASAVLLASLATTAYSQNQQGGSRAVLEEIVVTARKVEESLQSTPVAVSAITEEQMRVQQIGDLADVQKTAPNLQVATGGPGGANVVFASLRGQSSLVGTIAGDPAVGVYLDGVYVARNSSQLADMIDMQRVEVLRGPQGTLFGRNTTGGAISLLTNKPTDKLEGSLEVQLGNYEHREITGVLNVPVSDNLATRFVYRHSEHDGYGDNDFLGEDDLNDEDLDFYRVSALYTDPGGDWDLTVTFDQTDRKSGGQLAVLTGVADAAVAPFNALFPTSLPRVFAGLMGEDIDNYLNSNSDFWTNFANEDQYMDLTTRGVTATLNVDLGWGDFKSITGWRDLEETGFNDNDGTPLTLLNTDLLNEQEQWSQEFQLSGGKGKLSWIGGLYWFEEDASQFTVSVNFVSTLFAFLGTGQFIESFPKNDADALNTSRGAYAQVYYDFTDSLTLTVGARHTVDEREVTLKNLDSIGPPPVCDDALSALLPPGAPCALERDVDYDYWSHLIGLDWQVSDNLFLYAKTSRSFLAGGFNIRQGSTPAYEPEEVRDVELGAKTDWLDGRVRANLAIFSADQKGIQRQVSRFIGGTPTTFVANAGKSTVEGVELELNALLWEGMEARLTAGWIDAEYDEFTEERLIDGDQVIVDRSDEEIPQAPELTYSIGLTQRLSLALGELTLHADYSYMDDVVYFATTADPGASAQQQRLIAEGNELARQDSYELVSAKAALALKNSGWRFEIWGRNLTDEEYSVRQFADLYATGPFGYAWGFPGNPRTYGATVRYEF